MIKLKTGVSTSLEFGKALKVRGQDASPAFPADTLREQLDALSEEVQVTFNSTNETILQVVNDSEPGPVPPTPVGNANLTISLVNAYMEGSGETSVVIEVEKGTTFDLGAWYTENESDIIVTDYENAHYFTPVSGNQTLATTTVLVDADKTMYLEFYKDNTPFDWDGVNPDEVGRLIFKQNAIFDTSSQEYQAFMATLENYGNDTSTMFEMWTVDNIIMRADWNGGIPTLSFEHEDSTYGGTVATWSMGSAGLFVLQAGSATELNSADDVGGITFVNDGGSVSNMGYMALKLLQASMYPEE